MLSGEMRNTERENREFDEFNFVQVIFGAPEAQSKDGQSALEM